MTEVTQSMARALGDAAIRLAILVGALGCAHKGASPNSTGATVASVRADTTLPAQGARFPVRSGPSGGSGLQLDPSGDSAVAVAAVCGSETPGLCLVETRPDSGWLDERSGASMDQWLVVGVAGDSIELFAAAHAHPDPGYPGVRPVLQLLGVWRDAPDLGNRTGPAGAEHVRARLPFSGIYLLNIDLEDINGTEVTGYALRVNPVAFDARFRPVGGVRLTLASQGGVGAPVVIPDAIANSIPASDYFRWALGWGPWGVLAGPDTLYRVCHLPCTHMETRVLRPNSSTVWTF